MLKYYCDTRNLSISAHIFWGWVDRNPGRARLEAATVGHTSTCSHTFLCCLQGGGGWLSEYKVLLCHTAGCDSDSVKHQKKKVNVGSGPLPSIILLEVHCSSKDPQCTSSCWEDIMKYKPSERHSTHIESLFCIYMVHYTVARADGIKFLQRGTQSVMAYTWIILKANSQTTSSKPKSNSCCHSHSAILAIPVCLIIAVERIFLIDCKLKTKV